MLFDAKPLDLPLIYESEITDIQNIQQSRGEDSKTPSSATKASAPALTYLEVTYVGSSNAGWEWIDETKLITDEDHGGALMYVVTVELGYGGNPIAKMGGGQLPSSANFQTDTLCWTSGQLGACSAGQTVVGFLKHWDVSGWQNGYFTYQNKSLNYPYNTESDAISIR